MIIVAVSSALVVPLIRLKGVGELLVVIINEEDVETFDVRSASSASGSCSSSSEKPLIKAVHKLALGEWMSSARTQFLSSDVRIIT